jgi:hypothetical protein
MSNTPRPARHERRLEPAPGSRAPDLCSLATQAVTDLVKERFMLEEDAQTFIHAAETSDIFR